MSDIQLVVVGPPASKLTKCVLEMLKKLETAEPGVKIGYGQSWEMCTASCSGLTACHFAITVPGADLSFLKYLKDHKGCSWVHSFFAGVDGLMPFVKDTEPAFPITNTRNGYSRPLMEWTIAMMLHFSKDIPKFQKNKKTKTWEQWNVGELYNKNIGIIGYGGIGQEIGRVAKEAFGMKVLAMRHRLDKESPYADKVYNSNIEEEKFEIFRRSDFVVACLPQTEKTKGFCGIREFAVMNPESVFISIGRGTTVDQSSLEEVLKAKTIKGAALDVFESEPLPQDSCLWDLPNCFISSHNADWVPSFTDAPYNILEKNLAIWKAKNRSPAHSDMHTPIEREFGY